MLPRHVVPASAYLASGIFIMHTQGYMELCLLTSHHAHRVVCVFSPDYGDDGRSQLLSDHCICEKRLYR
jgi:hypothetical protein